MARGSLELDIKMEGLKELDKVLKGLPRGVARTQLRNALKRAAKPMAKDAKQRLRASDWDSRKAADTVEVRVMKNTRVPAAVSVGPDSKFWFAALFEKGFTVHPYGRGYGASKQPKGTPVKISAKAWLRPAWDAGKRKAARSIKDELWHVLSRYSERLKKQAYAGKLSAAGRKALGL